jgi:hypothetical protein
VYVLLASAQDQNNSIERKYKIIPMMIHINYAQRGNFLNKYLGWDEIKYWFEIMRRKGKASISTANHTQLRITTYTIL